eukprot:m.19243 g.19243  ORF g.19243 m.19243 type:complete len:319 (+) comp5085_c0_seq1:320-1276(+)
MFELFSKQRRGGSTQKKGDCKKIDFTSAVPKERQQQQLRQCNQAKEEERESKKGLPKLRRTRFHLVRHGERLDEVPFTDWFDERPPSKIMYDPPLTERGKTQAQQVASYYLMKKNVTSTTVYTSRMTRCVSTALELGTVLGMTEIRPSRGLAECSAAIRQRSVEGSRFVDDVEFSRLVEGRLTIGPCVDKQMRDEFMKQELGAQLSDADADVEGEDRNNNVGDSDCFNQWQRGEQTPRLSFRSSVVHLCEQHEKDGEFFVCSHREGLRDLLRYCGYHALDFGYCATAQFEYDHDEDKFFLVDYCNELMTIQKLPTIRK